MMLWANVDAKFLSSIALPKTMNLYLPELVGFPVAGQEGEASLAFYGSDGRLARQIQFSLPCAVA